MRRETAGVTESLLQAAKEEFLTYGFHDASMRRISAACGVSTNSIYTRFGDKSGLFTAIVQEAADGLMEMYVQSIQKATECPDMDHAIEEGNEGTDQVLAYIYGYKEEFQLLFCHSAGTEYEDYFDKLAAIEEQYYNIFAKQYANENATADEFFIHVFCRTGWQYIYEVLTHDKPYDEAAAFMKNVQIFNFAGWKAVFGLE